MQIYPFYLDYQYHFIIYRKHFLVRVFCLSSKVEFLVLKMKYLNSFARQLPARKNRFEIRSWFPFYFHQK